MKKYIYITIAILIGILTLTTATYYLKYNNAKKDLSTAIANTKSYESLYSESETSKKVLQLTIDQLNYSKDSVIERLNAVRKENKVLSKEIKELYFLLSEASIKDTVFLTQTKTIVEPADVQLDTLIENKWYTLGYKLKYPEYLTYSIKVPSEKYIITSTKKETINPPKRCKLVRLFQKKHKVLTVDVIEKNPYITNKEERFVKIID